MTERLQKIIAHAGICSRREAEKLIRDRKVTVNGKIAQIGDQADVTNDAIKVNNKLLIQPKAKLEYYLFNKPPQVLCRFGKEEDEVDTLSTFFTRVKSRIYPVNILEQNTEGLVFLTNDGKLKSKLTRSKTIKRVYQVKTKKHHSDKAVSKLSTGMTRNGRRIQPTSVKAIRRYDNKTLIEIEFEGLGPLKLRDYFEKKGFLVDRIKCSKLGPFKCSGIQKGQWVSLPVSTLKHL